MPSPARDPLTSRPLTVWLVNPFDDIPGEGIPPLRYWSLARELAGRGNEVIWWTAAWSHRRKTSRTTPQGIRADENFDVRLVAVRPYTRNISFARWNSHKDFGKNFERIASEGVSSGQLSRPDILLASMPPLESSESAQRLAARLDATFILDVQDLWPETFSRILPGPSLLRGLIDSVFLGNMANRRQALVCSADALSATTRTYAAAAFKNAPTAMLQHICPVGSYVDEFMPPKARVREVPGQSEEREQNGLEPEPPCPIADQTPGALEVVYAGSLEASQDLEILPAVVRQLSAKGVAATIHVAGSGKLEAILRSASSRNGSCRLVVHGLLKRKDYVRLLSRCEVGLVAVKPESMVALPNKSCDYAAAGLAIVNSLPGELADLLGRYEAGVSYAAGNSESMATAIRGLATNLAQLSVFRQNARRMAEKEFDRNLTYPLFADWIETMAGGV